MKIDNFNLTYLANIISFPICFSIFIYYADQLLEIFIVFINYCN